MSNIVSIDPSQSRFRVSRRGALALGAATSALALGVRAASADSIRTGGGIAGGGWVTWETGEAQMSVFASTFKSDGREEPIIFGSLRWADAAGFTLTSESVLAYGPIEPVETTRELHGFVRNSDGDTLHAFTLRLVDGGGPGVKQDTVNLAVGPALAKGGEATPQDAVTTDIAVISVDGTLEVGDIQLLTFDFPA